jgi:hypothetical protein
VFKVYDEKANAKSVKKESPSFKTRARANKKKQGGRREIERTIFWLRAKGLGIGAVQLVSSSFLGGYRSTR